MESQSSNPQYEPITCSLHDRIEAAATEQKVARIVFLGNEDATESIEDRIITWFPRDGAEFLTTASGRMIRLDRIISVDGVLFSDSCA